MMQQALRRTPAGQRHAEGVEGEVSGNALAHRPPDGKARAEIEDNRQVEPALACRNIGDVGHPCLVGVRPLELSRQDIGRDGKRMPRLGGHAEAAAPPSRQPVHAHQPRHPLAARVAAAVHQLGANPWAAVAVPALGMDRGDLQPQPRVRLRTWRRGTRLPRIETGARDLEYATQHPHREAGLLRGDEPEPHGFSFAKKAVAFFRMSRSMRSVRFSRRSRPSSSRSSVVSTPGAPRPASTSAWRTQLRSAVSVRSSSRATVPTALPLSRTIRTACALNSFVNARRFRLAMTPLLPHFRAIWGVYQTGAGSTIENAWYALHLAKDPASPARAKVWLRRGEDDEAKKRCRAEFSVANVSATHRSLDTATEKVLHQL